MREKGRFALSTVAPPAVVILSAALLGAGISGARAAATDCKSLLDAVVQSQGLVRVTIDPETEQVRLETPHGYCLESIAEWAARGETGARDGPAPSTGRKRSRLPAVPGSGITAPGERIELPPPPPPCDRQLDDYWGQGFHDIAGTRYWLAQVHTIDFDGDGATDDVGFTLKSGDSPDLVIRYKGGSGELSAMFVPSLRPSGEGELGRLCFARASFDRPPDRPRRETLGFQAPNLAQEAMDGPGAAPGKEPAPEAERWAIDSSWILVFASGTVLFLAMVGGAIFLLRGKWLPILRRRRRRSGHDDDGDFEDDEYEGEEEDE